MKLQHKILILLITTAGVIFFSLLFFLRMELKKKDIIALESQKNNELLINQILKMKSDLFEGLSKDYSGWDDMVGFVAKPDSTWAVDNIDLVIPNYKVSFASLYDKDKNLIYNIFDTLNIKIPLIIERNIIEASFKKSPYCHFFYFSESEVFEIFGSIIVPSNDFAKHQTPAQGYLLVAKQWNKDYIDQLALATNFKIRINNTYNSQSRDSLRMESYNYIRKLFDYKGNSIGNIVFSKQNTLKHELETFNNISTILGIITLLIICTFLFWFRKLVLVPLSKMSQTLDTGNINSIKPLLSGTGEFKKMAGLMVDFIKQKDELKEYNFEIIDKSNEILAQNEMLHLQKEEIQAQADNLENAFQEIQTQKKKVEKSHEEITASINYAYRIRNALLPQKEKFGNIFPKHFVFYQPRNIVSGDFYWTKTFNNLTVLVVADCTGHGVPGAFMSLLGISFLNEIVPKLTQMENQTVYANDVLNMLREQIISVLNQTDNMHSNSDGMDAAICIFDHEKQEMQFAGANMPVIIVQNNELTEYKPDKMPIGIHPRAKEPFTNQSIKLEKNANIYIFSDGIVDQYSHENKKKYLRNNFRKFLSSIQNLSIELQSEAVENEFNSWRKNTDQTDDILVIGIQKVF